MQLNEKFQNDNSSKKTTCLPVRYVFGVMSMLGIMIAYLMRACISITLTQMVTTHKTRTWNLTEEICPSPNAVHQPSSPVVGAEEGEFEWDEPTQGIILSAFYYGYLLTHVPGGLLAQKFGGKYILGLGILSTAIFTLLTPTVAYLGVTALVVLRFLEGLGEGVTFPALCTMLAQWAPPHERSTLTSAAFTGVHIGMVLANLTGGVILQYAGGWKAVFYIFGSVSVVWFLLWCVLCYNDPSSHPFISETEKLYLKGTIGETERKKDLIVPWREILTSKPVWALVIAEAGHGWVLFTMVSDLPKYMNDVMKFSAVQNGLWSSVPYCATWLSSFISSAFADWLLKKDYLSCSVIRKIFATIGAVGPALGITLASYAGCNGTLAIIYFTIGMGFMGFCYCSLRVNALDLSHNFSGTIMALVNGIGCISGMLTPTYAGLVIQKESTIAAWRVVFWTMNGIAIGSNIIFLLYGSAELQDWNEPTTKNTNKLKPDEQKIDGYYKNLNTKNIQKDWHSLTHLSSERNYPRK